MLKLMYITNRPEVAKIAEDSGVDRIFIDMEYIGKDERQAGMDTVKSHHTISDIKKIRPIINNAELLVRVNPIHKKTNDYCSSFEEINHVIDAGADIIMLPMFRNAQEVKEFLSIVDHRVKTILLLENKDAVDNLEDILKLEGIDEVHIGFNDLHISYKKKFMFELLTDGTVKKICKTLKNKEIPFGFGGIARIGHGALPAEYIIPEHYALGSQMVILSRSFCDANKAENLESIEVIFKEGIEKIRDKEREVSNYSEKEFEKNHSVVCKKIEEIVRGL